MSLALPSGWTTFGPLTSIFTPPPDCNTFTISYTTPVPVTTTGTETFTWPTPVTEPRLIWYDPVTAPSCFPTNYQTAKFNPPTITTAITMATITSGSTIYPLTTDGIFFPGRCPEGWATRLLEYAFIPANHTMAECCPVLPTETPSSNNPRNLLLEKDLEKRRGTKPNNKPNHLIGCSFALPSVTFTSSPTMTSVRRPAIASITAVANGTLTTMSPQAWSSIGDIGKRVEGTAVIVMWKIGDFPDIDKAAAAASASVSAANAGGQYAPGLTSGTKGAIAGGVIMAVLFGVLFFFVSKRQCMHRRG